MSWSGHLWAWIWLILVASGVSQAIDFGYHPSAEEFDSLLRTNYGRDLLQRRHPGVQDTRRFVPRYQHETSVRFDQPELDFQLFSQQDENEIQFGQPYVFESVEETANSGISDQLHVQSELLEIKEPTKKPPNPTESTSFPIYFTHPSTGIVYQISQVGGGGGAAGSAPQYPLNPSSQSRNDSNSIAIYVTKAQYDADMELMRRKYEKQCQMVVPPPGTVISTLNPVRSPGASGATTARPQIIRLKKPAKSPQNQKPNNKLPQKQNHRPPPVMVTSGPIDHVSDQLLKLPHRGATTTTSTTHRPNIRRKKRKKKRPTKPKVVKKRPGLNNTRNQPGPLPVILGKRPTTGTTTTPPPAQVAGPQLEKPHMPHATLPTTGNVFSQHLFRQEEGMESPSGQLELPQDPQEDLQEFPQELREVVVFRRRRSLDFEEGLGGERGLKSGSDNGGPSKDYGFKEKSGEESAILPLNVAEKKVEIDLLPPRRRIRSLEVNGGKKWLKKAIRKAIKKGARTVQRRVFKGPEETEESEREEAKLRRKRRSLETEIRKESPEGGVEIGGERGIRKGSEKNGSARRVSTPRRGSPSKRNPQSGKRKTKQKSTSSPPPSVPKKDSPSSLNHRIPMAVHLLHKNHSQEEIHHKDNPPILKQNKETKNATKIKRKTKERKRGRPDVGSAFDIFELMSDGDYEDDEDEDQDDEDYYFDGDSGTPKPHTPAEGHKVKNEDSSSAEEGADFGAMVVEETTLTPAMSSSEEEDQADATKNSMAKKKIRIKRRPIDSEEDYDEDEDSGIAGFFRMIFYPVQVAMSRLMDGFSSPDEDDDKEPLKGPTITRYPTYTLYHSAHSNEAYAEDEDDGEEEEEESSSLGSWFGSWFGLQQRTKKSGSTTTTSSPVTPAPTKEAPGWLESWFGFGKTSTAEADGEDDYDKWFASWFEGRPKRKVRRRSTTSTSTSSTSTTTTSTTTPSSVGQMPILTIVDPLRNPQNWIGILAHHIVNSTSTTTGNPLLQALATRMSTRGTTTSTTTTTTTSRPDVPRRISYDKYQIWRLKPQDEGQVRALEEFKKGEDGVKMHWLKGPSLRGLTDVLVAPRMLVDFQGTLNYEGIAHEVLIFDVGKAIAYERSKEDYLHTTRPSKLRPTIPSSSSQMSWNRYHNHDEIVKYLEVVRMKHPQLVELIHIGRSYEGRPLIVVKIESKDRANPEGLSEQKRPKRKRKSGRANAVFVEAGAQGLAWIGPATATWMIAEILRLIKSNKTNEDMEFVRNTTWYIMPVLNPDGYAFSHEYDRFWRKSRSQHQAPPPTGILDSAMTWLQQKQHGPEKVCYGVDLDRNWLYHWGKRGSSKAPCNEFYAGPAPFSEPETKAVSDFLMDYRTQIKLYISLQAYGQVVSYPVKANSTFNAERLDDFLDVAMVGTDGLRKKGHKSRYKVDASNDLIEQRSGCSDAFAAYEIGIPFSYTIQLADNGVHGYLLPSSAIEPTARDAFEIISGMLDYI
ncbi:hypothetical protein KR067_007394 [Drosophila pandora]|nr:hypothetical protein KR067_007394 [Drosophila pandora]